jgi:hypothetical protein
VARSREIDVTLVEAGASISTRHNTFLGLRSVAKFAVEAKILPAEPMFLPLPKRGKRVPSAPPAQDVAAVGDFFRLGTDFPSSGLRSWFDMPTTLE